MLRAALVLALFSPYTTDHVPPAAGSDGEAVPWPVAEGTWRTDPVWHDGLAEKCTYEASRQIYYRPREYVATAYTNKQHMDPTTMTKAAGSGGVEVFKHHWSERVPTENYDYDFSTAVFLRTADLAPFKLTVATQEDCGASFKQVWREGERLNWLESVYFPDAGLKQGELEGSGVQLQDALTLALRDFPFEAAEVGDTFELCLVRRQKDTRRVPLEPRTLTFEYKGIEVLDLPVGKVEAFRVGQRMKTFKYNTPVGDEYWFAVDASAPWLHALVRHVDSYGQEYRLRSIERTAYWER